MTLPIRSLITALLLITLPAISAAAPVHAEKAAAGGAVLVAPDGRTLYTFRKDAPGRSACTGSCLAAWPPFLAKSGAKADAGATLIKRPDGRLQWASPAGLPWYFYAGDRKPGDVNGDGVGGVWDAARP